MILAIELDVSSDDLNRQFVRRIQESEVKDVLKRMKGGKTMDSDGIHIELWRSLRDVAIFGSLSCLTLYSDRTRCPMSGGGVF
jgi:hypothetical protein